MDRINEILSKTFRVTVTDDMTIDDIDTWDSLTHMELVANLESELKIEFSADDIVDMTSIKAIKKVISEKK